MLLSPKDCKLFFILYPSLISHSSNVLGGIKGIKDLKSFLLASNEARAEARDALLKNLSLIDNFVEANPEGFKDEELQIVLSWKRFLQGDFFIIRDLNKYTVFLDTDKPSKAYGVLGLFNEIVDIVPLALPVYVKAVLLPWKGQIICDGQIESYGIHFGGGIRHQLNESYKLAKARGIITSLEPDWQPERKEPIAPKTPAISRLLKKCPKKVSEFKEFYGKPGEIYSGEKLKEIGVWDMKGKPPFKYDSILVYPNIIKGKWLQLYTKGDEIIQISVMDFMVWQKSNLRPRKGKSLIR